MKDITTWTIIGMLLMSLEIFGLPGLGILFAGFSAITVAATIYFDPALIDDIGSQLVYFFIYTIMWTAILWFPLNKFIQYGDSGDYTNIIGTYATVNGMLVRGEVGEVSWSGTKVRAMIDPDSQIEEIADKTHVKVSAVVDGIFYIRHAKDDTQ